MKRMALIAVLLLILTLLPAALADTQPSVSFTTNQITAQCGNTVTLTLAANAAPSRDITINITDERGNPFPVVLRQGETRATLQVTTARAGYNKRYEYAIQPGSDYQRGATRGVSVLYKGVTVGQFSQEMLQTYLGETLNVGFKLEGPKTLEKGQIIYLRDEQGKTVAEVPYTGREFYSVALRMDSDWRPMKTLSLHMGQELPADSTLMVFVGDRSEISIVGVRRDDNKIAFTMDCGSSMQYAQTVLDTLDRYNVKITFFVTGNFAKGHPDIVQQFVARGHEIGNHSYHHVHLLTAGLKEIWEEVAPANDLLEQVAGVRPTLYRPPYGNSHERIRAVVEGAGLKVIRWSHSLNDSDDTNQVASRSFACATANITPGSIILSHLDSRATVEALPDILQWYQEHGFEVVPVSELLLQGDVTVDSEGYQVYRKDLK